MKVYQLNLELTGLKGENDWRQRRIDEKDAEIAALTKERDEIQ